MLSSDIKNMDIKKSLEQYDSGSREVAYLGIAIGFYDAFLDKNSEVDSVKQLQLLSKVDRDKLLSILVEITIVDLPLLESMFSKVEDTKLKLVNKTRERTSYCDVYDALGIKDLFSPSLIEASSNNTTVLSTAIIHSKLAYNEICCEKE